MTDKSTLDLAAIVLEQRIGPEIDCIEFVGSNQRLTYCDDELKVRKWTRGKKQLTDGSILDFTAVITSTRRDRDGDILEARGATIDERMPLLWQHNPSQVIGKLVNIVQRNSKRVTGRFAIADTALGQDAAKLIEFGAVRVSHGFNPTEVEQLDDDRGVHIKEFEIMETSLVSVPSNTDAVITAFDRGKFCSAQVKAWAGSLKEIAAQTVTSTPPVIREAFTEDTEGRVSANLMGIYKEVDKVAVPFSPTTAAPDGRAWDSGAANRRLRTWSAGGGEFDLATAGVRRKFRQGFAFVRGDGASLADYALPHHDVIGGEIHVVWHGAAAAMGAILGARGGVDLNDADRRSAYNHVRRHYSQFDREPPAFRMYSNAELAVMEYEDCLPCPVAEIGGKFMAAVISRGFESIDEVARFHRALGVLLAHWKQVREEEEWRTEARSLGVEV